MTLIPLFSAPIYDSIERKIKAAIQSRIGPIGFPRSFLQSWFDIIKLFNKELVLTSYGVSLITILELILILITMIILQIALLTSQLYWIISLLITFLSTSTAFSLFRAILLDNPFSSIGAFRGFYITLTVEGFFLSSLIIMLLIDVTIISRILLFCVIAISCYVVGSKVPFDIAEAEPEIASGVYVELSGPLLAIALYSLQIKRYILAQILSYSLLKLINTSNTSVTALMTVLLTPIIWMIFGIVSAIFARTRVDVGPSTLLKVVLTLMLLIIATLTVKVV
jgi:formate hydrogenlyase subunit 4